MRTKETDFTSWSCINIKLSFVENVSLSVGHAAILSTDPPLIYDAYGVLFIIHSPSEDTDLPFILP